MPLSRCRADGRSASNKPSFVGRLAENEVLELVAMLRFCQTLPVLQGKMPAGTKEAGDGGTVRTETPIKRIVLCSILLMFAGCTDTGPIKIGPDTYTISTRVPFGGPASAKGEALQEANSYCSSQGREILLQHEQSSECALHGGCGEAEIVFYCLTSGDPQLRRPELKAEPNQRIEVNQK
ncbi:hypothetical protein [Paraburkholderia fungorum]|uniref:hypothetical protein n=1 Tax=Paraburkholderia fungorum TaxID=134537 RepID=UPI0020983EB9|nr:hypothetical protein [Paraburkholderia fungorum]USX11044.1 hypothetical protein NHH62_40775 [Paraburkholderia fungorum]